MVRIFSAAWTSRAPEKREKERRGVDDEAQSSAQEALGNKVAQSTDESDIGENGTEELPAHNSIAFILDVEFGMSGCYILTTAPTTASTLLRAFNSSPHRLPPSFVLSRSPDNGCFTSTPGSSAEHYLPSAQQQGLLSTVTTTTPSPISVSTSFTTKIAVQAHNNETKQFKALIRHIATAEMSSLARILHEILSTIPPSANPPDFERLLFTISTATMAPEHLQYVQKIRNVLGPGPILQLPAELLWEIFELLPRKDKGSFRGTNKLLCAATKLPFASTLPSTWRFEMTEKGLDGLVSLTADKDLVTRCEDISFSTSRLVEILKDTCNTQELAHNERATQHLDFLLGGHHIEAIVKALGNLRANGKTAMALGVYDDWPCTETAFAADEFLKRPVYDGESRRWDMQDTLLALDVGIRCARFKLQAIRLEFCDFSTISSKDMFWTQLDVIPDMLFSCIESSTARISSGQHRLQLTSVCIGWLRSMPKLESLELERVGDVHDEPLFKEKICWQSREEIQTGLDKLIPEIEA
ncbi:hypothetical protein KCV07_g9486, partial [Aureobasidium melanogenum]